MEFHPTSLERLLEIRLSAFGQRVLDDDTCSLTIVRQLTAHASSLEGLKLVGILPSVQEVGAELIGGVQIGYEKQFTGGSIRNYIFTDLFGFDATRNTHRASPELQHAATEMANPGIATENAWRAWLGAMHALQTSMVSPLYFDRATCEVSLSQNIPPDDRVLLELPSF